MGGIERGEHNLTIQTAMTISRNLGISLSNSRPTKAKKD